MKNREIIAETFLEMLDEKLLNKITVKDIVERCGVNRNTFYYYYQDIPSLLESILISRIDELVEKHARIGSLQDCVFVTSRYFTENRKAVMHVYHALDREVFLQHLDHLLNYLVREYLDEAFANHEMDSRDRTVLIRYCKCLMTGWLLDWLDHDMSYDLNEDIRRLSQLRHSFEVKDTEGCLLR